jgi:hypothetical protein
LTGSAVLRLVVIAGAAAFAASSVSGLWVTRVLHLGGQGALRVYGTSTPWAGHFWPWFGIALASAAAAAGVALLYSVRLRGHAQQPWPRERFAYAVAGLIGVSAMCIAVVLGPGGSHNDDRGLVIVRSGALAYVGIVLSAVPLVAATLLPARRYALASVLAVGVLATAGAMTMLPTKVRLDRPSGPIPDWRTTPEEPYPFTGPVPPQLATAVDGVYSREPTDMFVGVPRAGCSRCPPFPMDAGRSTLRLDRGRYYLSHEAPPYRTSGHYVVARTHVTFYNDPECGTVRGVYRWKLDGDQLTLTTLFDPCAFGQRGRDLSDSAWAVVPVR